MKQWHQEIAIPLFWLFLVRMAFTWGFMMFLLLVTIAVVAIYSWSELQGLWELRKIE